VQDLKIIEINNNKENLMHINKDLLTKISREKNIIKDRV